MPKQRFEESVESTEWKPSLSDTRALSEKLKLYKSQKRNGRFQTAFEQYLEKENIISFDEFGRIQVKNPLQYKRKYETYDLMNWLAEKEQETFFQSFPEERAAYEEKVQGWKMDVRSVLEGFKAA